MSSAIRNIGSALETDKDGYIVKAASADKIQPEWRPAVDTVVNAYVDNLGDDLHSVYIRGSVAKGEAIEHVSDLDTIALTTTDKGYVNTDWMRAFRQKFAQDFPFVSGVEIQLVPIEDIGRNNRILIKTQTACIYGEDIAPQLPPLKPGRDTMIHAFALGERIEETVERLKTAEDPERIAHICTWIMKRIVRTGCELVMERSGKYTRDLYPCYELFSGYYPEKSDEMYHALELAIHPSQDAREIIDVLEGIGGWLVREVNAVLKNDR